METDYSRMHLCTGCDQPRVRAVTARTTRRARSQPVGHPLDCKCAGYGPSIIVGLYVRWLWSVDHCRTVSALVTVRPSSSDCKCAGYGPSIIVGL